MFVLLPLSVRAGSHKTATVNYLLVSGGLDNQSGNHADAALDIALNRVLRVNAQVGETTTDSDTGSLTTRQLELGLTGSHPVTASSTLSWSLGYRHWGNNHVIESRDWRIGLGYRYASRWNIAVDYETGNIKAFIKPEFSNRGRSVNSDRRAWRLSTGYTASTGTAWVSFLRRDYAKDITTLTRRRALRRAIKRFALDQAYALSKQELNLGYEHFFESLDLGLEYNRITLIINDQHNQYASLYTRFYIGRSWTTGLRVEQEIGHQFTDFTVDIGLAW